MMDPEISADESYVSVPRGGPIYVSDMVGPLTKVADFEVSIFRELERLKAELSSDSLEMFDDEISIEDLKTICEEDLVAQAFEEAFKDEELKKDSSQTLAEHLGTRRTDNGKSDAKLASLERSEREVDSYSKGSNKRKSNKRKRSKHVPAGSVSKKGSNKRKSNKKKWRKENDVDEHYMPKVEQLAKIQEKQEEEKAAARLHSFNGRCSSSQSAPISSSRGGRMISLKSVSLGTKVRAVNTHEHIAVQFPEAILCVEIYHYKKSWIKTQEFLVLGRQFLTEMRDKIYCITDEIMKKTGKSDPSGFFLVEDVFCNDFRHPSASDYSKPILDWIQDSRSEVLEKWESITSAELPRKQKALFGNRIGPQLPHFKAIEMQKTRFCDLRFRLGAGYLYCHQGDCKHQVVIRDMRLIHPEDVQNRAAYPLITFQSKLRFQKCSVCKIFKAVKVTVDDKWAAENPCYFCELCYYMLHYVNVSLLYDDFSVYEYLHE
ncbi:snRNA-activating protein complex subunit isoform X1 [Capsicum annuum]|uniref:snRNA-activating protein complex subunit isoform X1 n=2 Tax=Capsicum annuum TaxID=4072 RepID=UPI0007BED50B|nr:snRNA-activating protein complex subunit isoform X1 [Capsicum annuum]XP_016545229.1 snRNA-activating protein complex subunit isoform X1 [Capsicum annuum]XP_016545231.1 snRNA-activating protein complex subunit isoform X1 [Capsicum annuum]XP_047254487.1 snRNA-activating protein complex subunit isoform X1 [Capsicum annuum]XP_047254488.1 snRNA-activating protein complex subunit isoform X1 [Capsicum annuum]XP_047254490.1 snRNA-activating protein complex subunit isoform X1 [Capsicum annuum]XP_04